MNIAYVSYEIQEKYLQGLHRDEDQDLLTYLQAKGLLIQREVWNDPSVDWTSYDWAILKSPWDYHEHIDAFYAWLTKLDTLGVRLLNPTDTVRWNADKHYLADMERAGLEIIPSYFLERDADQAEVLPELFNRWKTDTLVVKPCVSAGAKDTLLLAKDQVQTWLPKLSGRSESLVIQPFVPEVREGEWSFVFFHQTYSHCVLKIPKADDFRVQHYYGGEIRYPSVDEKYVQLAARYVREFAPHTLYARVDGLIQEDRFFLMELELIEPYLFLDGDEARLERYYRALTSLI